MEKRKNSLGTLKICRFCLGNDDTLSSLYDRIKKPKNNIPLSLKILSCLSIEVFPSDKMPTQICQRCRFFMELFYDYKELCRTADDRIMQYVHSGTSLETMSWPRSLTKFYRLGTKSKPNVMRTVTEDGATVQVTSQDMTDSEDEDEENVYNIKIGDGSEEGPKCIKVVTSKSEDSEKTKAHKEFSSVSRLTRHLRSHAGERLFPCKYCDKSFLRSHHHTRHVRLSHRDEARVARAQGADQYRCEQCDECFESQDELIYHSAIHATQNLTCPLCQEKFEDVDAVTAHIKSHVNGMEFMCDLCELVFTSKEKLDKHLTLVHAEELDHDESTEDMDAEEDEDDNGINVKEEDDHMVVEIKKPDGFMLPEAQSNNTDEKLDNTNSEESETEAAYTESPTVDTLAIVNKESPAKVEPENPAPAPAPAAAAVAADTSVPAETKVPSKPEVAEKARDSLTASILRKAEEVKRKAQSIADPEEKKEKIVKTELGASDKSLRLLEKELQELKRTNTRNETSKTPVRTMETLRNRRPQLHTSTPKTRAESEKRMLASVKSPAFDKKVPERRVLTKENKEPKEAKETKTSSASVKEEKRDEKDTPKNVVKNGNNDKSSSEEAVRRSTRPSKIKDYAKMIRDKAQESDDESDYADDDEYREVEKTENKPKPRRGSTKTPVKTPPAPTPMPTPPAARKRGRPRKDQSTNKEVPSKIKKDDHEKQEEDKEREVEAENPEPEASSKPEEPPSETEKVPENVDTPAGNDANLSPSSEQKTPSGGGVLMSPTGQTLKKVPIRALPPGIKPLPLPVNARPMGAGELCEMQIGKKVVKVQKIVMTKAEVEAMAKKGLVEMKDGTMVLKQGIKIPTSDALTLKSTLVGDKEAKKESPSKMDKPSLAQSNTSE